MEEMGGSGRGWARGEEATVIDYYGRSTLPHSRRAVKARLVLHKLCRGQADQTDGVIERSISVYLTRTEGATVRSSGHGFRSANCKVRRLNESTAWDCLGLRHGLQ